MWPASTVPGGGADQLIISEALLRTLFANCRVIGLCLYHRDRMPLRVIDGALATHPIVGVDRRYSSNPFYEADRRGPAENDDHAVRAKLRAVAAERAAARSVR